MNDAIQVDFLLAGLTDANGNDLTSGKVYTYGAGTDTTKTTWTESDKSVAAANPVVLGAYGRALIFADGNYKFVVKDADDNTLYTWDNLEYGNQGIILPETSAPAGVADKIQITGMADGLDTEMRVTDGAGNAIQMTKDGNINAMAIIGASTDNQVMRWNGAGGDVPQGSAMVLTDAGDVTGLNDITTTGTLVIGGGLTMVGSIAGVTNLTMTGSLLGLVSITMTGNIAGAQKISASDTITFSGLPTGATQVAAGAAAGELWVTDGHASQEDATVMIGV